MASLLRHPNRKYDLDESVFDHAETDPTAAYWVGFLMADGSVKIRTSGQHTVTLALAESDGNHVEAFRRFLKTDSPVKVYKNSRGYANSKDLSTLTVTSKRLAVALSRYGVVPKKSKTAEVKLLERNRDFWRGMIDGDGWFTIRRDGPILGLTGSLQIIAQFGDFVKESIGHTCNIHPNHSVWKLSTFGRQTRALAELLYQNGDVSLSRKLAKAQSAMAWEQERGDRSTWTLDFLLELHSNLGSRKAVAEHLGVTKEIISYTLYHRRRDAGLTRQEGVQLPS